jgi:hypothetical protein
VLIDGMVGARIVKLSENRVELFQKTRTLQLPGLDAGGLPVTSMDHQKHRPPADATGSQFPDLYAVPFGEYQVAEGASPAFAPVTLNHSHTVWSVVRKLEAGVGTEQLLVSTAFVTI